LSPLPPLLASFVKTKKKLGIKKPPKRVPGAWANQQSIFVQVKSLSHSCWPSFCLMIWSNYWKTWIFIFFYYAQWIIWKQCCFYPSLDFCLRSLIGMPATASRRRDSFIQCIRETIKTARDNQKDFLSIFHRLFCSAIKADFCYSLVQWLRWWV
jgi:hypothetical protein